MLGLCRTLMAHPLLFLIFELHLWCHHGTVATWNTHINCSRLGCQGLAILIYPLHHGAGIHGLTNCPREEGMSFAALFNQSLIDLLTNFSTVPLGQRNKVYFITIQLKLVPPPGAGVTRSRRQGGNVSSKRILPTYAIAF